MSQASHSPPKDRVGWKEEEKHSYYRFNTSPGRSKACPTSISYKAYRENSISSFNLGNSTWRGSFMDIKSQISRYNSLAVHFPCLGLRQSWQSQLGHLPEMVLPTLPQQSTTSKVVPAREHQEMRLGKRCLSNPTPSSHSCVQGPLSWACDFIKKSHNEFLLLVLRNQHTKWCWVCFKLKQKLQQIGSLIHTELLFSSEILPQTAKNN